MALTDLESHLRVTLGEKRAMALADFESHLTVPLGP
jgi:hypothetical protein